MIQAVSRSSGFIESKILPFKKCMTDVSTNSGENGNLAVIIRKYAPNVQCHPPYPLPATSCYGVLKMMPASTDNLTFGPRNGQGTQAVLPQQIQAGRSLNSSMKHSSILNKVLWCKIPKENLHPIEGYRL